MGQGRAFAYPKRYAVLSLRLDTAFMFPADARGGDADSVPLRGPFAGNFVERKGIEYGKTNCGSVSGDRPGTDGLRKK